MKTIKNILEAELPTEIIVYILDLLGEEWEKAVRELCQHYFPKSEFNLAKYIIEKLLVHYVQNEDRSLVKKLTYMSRNFRVLQQAVENSNEKNRIFSRKVFENNGLKEFINIFQIEDENLLLSCKEFLKENSWWVSKPTKRNNKYSTTKWCIKELSETYFTLRKETPECHHNGSQEGTEREFSGKFYDFLLEITPLLKRIGIDLGKENSIGEYARRTIRNNRKNYTNPQS